MAVLDALGLDRVVVLGSSMGGLVAMALAGRHATRVAGVALNDVGPVMEPAGFARFQRYAGRLPGNATWTDAAAQVRSIAGPTEHLFDGLGAVPALVLRGAVSDLFSAATVAEMQRRKPDLVAVTVPGRGHCPLLDEPESIAAIDDLLRRAA